MKETEKESGKKKLHNSVVFKPYVQNQLWLLPPNLGDLIPEGHIARLVNHAIDEMDISSLLSGYKGGGTSSYHPRMLLKALVYGYVDKRYSSRSIEKALQENICYMWLCGMQQPDHNTLNRFRNSNLKHTVKEVFAQILAQLVAQGYVRMSEYYVDGTKMESVAGRYTFVWAKNVDRYKAGLLEKIADLIDHIEAVNEQGDASEEEESESASESNNISNKNTPPEQPDKQIKHSDGLKDSILKLKKDLKEKGNETKKLTKQLDKLQKEYLPKLQKYEEQERLLNGRNSYSKTDPDATFMRTKEDHLKNGQLKPSYNIQAGTENQFIINYTVHQTPSDMAVFKEHMTSTLELLEHIGVEKPKRIGADAGYGSEENYEFLEETDLEAFVKYPGYYQQQKGNYKKRPFHPDTLFYNAEQNFYVCPMGQRMEFVRTEKGSTKSGYENEAHIFQARRCEGCPLRTSCHKSKENRKIKINLRANEYRNAAKEKLNSLRGIRMRKQRNVDVEPVFGHIKHDRQFRRFMLTGIQGVHTEFGLLAIAHNLKKWCANQYKFVQMPPEPPISEQNILQQSLKNDVLKQFFEKIERTSIFLFLTNFSINLFVSSFTLLLNRKSMNLHAF